MADIFVVRDPSLQLVEPTTGRVELKLLHAEQIELDEAVELEERHLVLDEVVDVIYRARQVAQAFGVTPEMLEQYAAYKGALRAVHKKDKDLEHYIAFGIVHKLKG